MTRPTLEELHAIDLFDDLDPAQLSEWVAVARVDEYEPGALVFEQGVEPPGLMLLLEGEVQNVLVDGDRTEPVGRQQAPTWMGAIAVLTGGTLGVRMSTCSSARLALIESDDFRRLAFAQPSVHQRVMQQVAPVMTRITGMEQNRERLASLGTMAAGLAHELNNPAAAARRAASQMAEALEVIASTIGRFVASGIEREQAEQLVELQARRSRAPSGAPRSTRSTRPTPRTSCRRASRSSACTSRGGSPSRSSAPGWTRDWLDLVAGAAGPATDAALALGRGDAGRARPRGGAAGVDPAHVGLVGAVKTYAYMDRGELRRARHPRGPRDHARRARPPAQAHLHRGQARLRQEPAQVDRARVGAQPGLDEPDRQRDRRARRSRHDHDHDLARGGGARVDVSDNGTGIPTDIRERVFDSFFTTKDVGHGTGLGLATARRIVVDRHDGTLSLDSEPGGTTFHVWLPLNQS